MATIVTTFTTINGMLVHEDRGGVETEYVSDPLGSLVQTRNSSGTKSYEAEYWPYGELQTSTGTNPSSWGYVGLLGYLADTATMLYVRARYLMAKFARWLTVDSLWPSESAYHYSGLRPAFETDPSGMGSDACLDGLTNCVNRVDRGKNTCTMRVMDKFADDYRLCAGSLTCISNAYVIMMAGLAACYAKYDPGYMACWLVYVGCVQRRSPIPGPFRDPKPIERKDFDWRKRYDKYGGMPAPFPLRVPALIRLCKFIFAF